MRVRISVDAQGDEYVVDLVFMDTMSGANRGPQIDEAVRRIKAAMGVTDE